MSEYQHLEDVLPGFTDARDIIKGADDSIFPLQYKGDKFEFYRFANRYRMAKRFRGIELDGFEQPTQDGYSALTRVFLVCSVFGQSHYLLDRILKYSMPPYFNDGFDHKDT